jgi:hypothetical protein
MPNHWAYCRRPDKEYTFAAFANNCLFASAIASIRDVKSVKCVQAQDIVPFSKVVTQPSVDHLLSEVDQ